MSIKNKELFMAMRNIFYGGEFSTWLNKQTMPMAALKEFEEAEDYFIRETNFDTRRGKEEPHAP